MDVPPQRPAKIARPRSGRILHRERLYRLLDASRRPIAWISGPPGCGKTTTVAGYLDSRALPCVWYQIDEDDADIAGFFYHLRLAAEAAAPQPDDRLPLLTPEYLPQLDIFSKRFFSRFFHQLPPGTVLVLDNYQDVGEDAALHAVLRDGLGEAPNDKRVICMSRGEPPAAWSRLRAGRRIAFLDWETLRLERGEAGELAALLDKDGRVDGRLLDAIHRRCQGWAAGVVLALEGIGRNHIDAAGTGLISLTAVADYFTQELFLGMDRRKQSFLLKIAVLPTIYPAVAERLARFKDAEQVLDELNRNNLFVDKRQQAETAYRFHPLLRGFLLLRAQREFSLIEVKRLHRRAGRLLAATGKPDEAVEQLLAGEDWPQAAALVLECAPAMASQGRHRTLAVWLDRFPETQTRAKPWLDYWRGIAAMPRDLADSRLHFEKAFSGFQRKRDREGQLLAWAGVVETLFAEWSEFQRMDPWIEHLLALLGDPPDFPCLKAEVEVTAALLAALMFRQPDHPLIAAWAERAFVLLQRQIDPVQKLKLGFSLVHYLLFIGDQVRVRMAVDELAELERLPGVPPVALNAWYHSKAAYHWHAFDGEACLSALHCGLETANEFGMHFWDARLLAQGVYLALTSSDLEDARGYLASMREALPTMLQLDRSHYHFLQGWADMLAGEDQAALQHVEQGLTLALETPFPEGLNRILRAQLRHRVGDVDGARADLRRACAIGQAMNSAELLIPAHFLKTSWALEANDRDLAEQALQAAFSLATRNGCRNGPLWQPALLSRLCGEALRLGIEVDYVSGLIRERGLLADPSALDIENWPWPLKITCLDRFTILVDDQPLRFRRKTQRRPLELLKILIAYGGRAVPETAIADNLWPDADADAAFDAYTTTLYRLRKLPGFEQALERRDGSLTLDHRRCWMDVWAFERLLDGTTATAGSGEIDGEESLQRLQRAVALYRNNFLADDTDPPWVLPVRERLRSKYLRALTLLGEHWQQAGAWEQAIDCYLRGLEADDLAEALYQRLMACYLRQGRRAEGIAVYRRCRDTLTARLGVTPGPDTQALLQTLKNAADTRHSDKSP